MESALDFRVAKRRRIEHKEEATGTSEPSTNGESKCNECLSANGADIPAEALCFTCEQYYCTTCIFKHNTAFRTDHHTLDKRDRDTGDQISKLIDKMDNVQLIDELMKAKVKPMPFINAKHVRDSNTSWLSGCTVLSNNNLAVVDYDNSSIKIMNTQEKVILQYFKMDTKIWDICELDSDHVVITCPERKSLVVLDIKAAIQIADQIFVNVDCHGISFVQDRFYISSTSPAVVQILDKSGQVLRQFEKNEAGIALFDWPLYLAVNPKVDTILVSDYFNDKVVIVNLGNLNLEVHYYKHDKLKYPRGIVYDDAGSVFLAGRYNIHQMTANCRHVQVALDTKDGIEFSQCVSYSSTDNLLFVGKHRSNMMSNYISVFHIE